MITPRFFSRITEYHQMCNNHVILDGYDVLNDPFTFEDHLVLDLLAFLSVHNLRRRILLSSGFFLFVPESLQDDEIIKAFGIVFGVKVHHCSM